MDINFFDWTYLGTFAGALAAVILITELIKEIPGIKRIPTQLVSWVLAYIIIILAQVFTNVLSVQSAVLALFNAALVSLSANGGYEAVKRFTRGNDEVDLNKQSSQS